MLVKEKIKDHIIIDDKKDNTNFQKELEQKDNDSIEEIMPEEKINEKFSNNE